MSKRAIWMMVLTGAMGMVGGVAGCKDDKQADPPKKDGTLPATVPVGSSTTKPADGTRPSIPMPPAAGGSTSRPSLPEMTPVNPTTRPTDIGSGNGTGSGNPLSPPTTRPGTRPSGLNKDDLNK